MASCKSLKWGLKDFNLVSKAACFTGAGIVAGLVGTAVRMALEMALDVAAEKMDDVQAAAKFIDSVCPPNVTGAIITGSPNVFVNTEKAAITVESVANCKKKNTPPRAADGSATVLVNNQHKHRKDDAWECGAKTVKASSLVQRHRRRRNQACSRSRRGPGRQQERENALLKEVSALQAENVALRKELQAAQVDAAKKGSVLPAHASGAADDADTISENARKAG
ncbi:MAG: PAAR domain-containing protein [Desulfovibrio sp.]|nr:PAAR domain-containing protein [Desulfovibrio sp.]